MRTTELDRETKKATEPAKRWRNKYWTHGILYLKRSGRVVGGDETWVSFSAYPSKEIAETKGYETIAKLSQGNSSGTVYLGAFPVSE